MKYKKMLGETIYRLRKKKGLSQSELGALVGVSNKAVSKWETDEANPDISLLPLIAEVFGVTTDELLTDVKAEKNYFKPKEAKFLTMKGTEINTPEKYEFISDRKTKSGVPYVHVHIGKRFSTINAKARGVIAIGNNAKGVISLGLVSRGVISLGLVSFGVLAFGLFAVGLLAAFATIAIGGAAIGAFAAGVFAFGAIAVGYVAFGGIAIGVYAHTGINGIAIGKHIFIH